MMNSEIKLLELRNALLNLSRKRQFGPCWCDTIAGLYCVGQDQCKQAQQALDDSVRLDKLTIRRCWFNSPRKHISSIRLLLNNHLLIIINTDNCKFVSEGDGLMAMAEDVATRMGIMLGVDIQVEDWGESVVAGAYKAFKILEAIESNTIKSFHADPTYCDY